MRLSEIETMGDAEFPYENAERILSDASPKGAFDNQFTLFYAEDRDVRSLLLVDDDKKVAALATFISRKNGSVWQSKNVATYPPYTGLKLSGRLYKYVKDNLHVSIQSDYQQTWSGKRIWTKILPSLGMKPMVFDAETEKIIDPKDFDPKLMYPEDSQIDVLHRYMWVLEKYDHYPVQNMLSESTLLMPYTGLWYNYKKETK